MKFVLPIFTAFLAFANAGHTQPQRRANIFNDDVIECTVSIVFGMIQPGWKDVDPVLLCASDAGEFVRIEGHKSLMGDSFVSGETRLSIPRSVISHNDFDSVNFNEVGSVIAVSTRRARRKLTTTGTKKVLVILVTDTSGNSPSQSEAQMTNDVFTDENNLKVRYTQCTNNQLTFNPATGTNVSDGVITVQTTTNLNGVSWQSCGTIGTGLASGISRDFTMIICPNVVSFGGAAAYGQMPGSISWYLSSYASAPIVQVHEVGHNLGHHHSGKSGVEYADPTCNMGNQGSWSDTGSAFCFNAAKTWANGWYSAYHSTVTPSSSSFDGTIVGINAVADGAVNSGESVVVRITGSGETNKFLMFNRQTGANSGVPSDGNEVVIVSQSSTTGSVSAWEAGLSNGQTFTESNWAGSSNSLVVSVCSLSTSGTGSARILIYVSGVNDLSCDSSTPAPTGSTPTTSSPVSTPTTSSPVSAPTTSSPVSSPISLSPVSTPTTSSPVSTPTTSSPVSSPTSSSPVSSPNSSSPVSSPISSSPVSTPAPTRESPNSSSPDSSPNSSSPASSPNSSSPDSSPNSSSPASSPNSSSPDSTPTTSSPVSSPTTSSPVSTPTTSSPVSTPTSLAPTISTTAPTSSPVSTPTTRSPTRRPTSSPITSPTTNQCQDQAGKFTYNGKRKNCVWVSKKKTTFRCSKSGVTDACPVTCDAGCVCHDTKPNFSFNGKIRTCDWVGRKNKAKRCKKNILYVNCPVTCGACV